MSKECLSVKDEMDNRIINIKSIVYLQTLFDFYGDMVNEPNYETISINMQSYLIDKLLLAAHELEEYWTDSVRPILSERKKK